ncbi:rolling circle replication-associated protein [Alkalicoccobacillus gibsonii]|uniref:rolling circle replication-associated protein n=1 Tax=Alkalicoccobacillus gibsonii TaxID=79881 RepID=UPI003F7C2CD5
MAGYNQKIVRSGSSYIEIWEYEKPIYIKDELIENYTAEQNENNNREKTKRKTFEELSPIKQQERLNRMNKTRMEAKWNLLRMVDANFCDKTSFLTLTTKKNILDRDEFNNELKTFIKRFNYNILETKQSKLKYCAVLERQQRGCWHTHILLFGVPYVPHDKLLKLWGHGAVRINKLKHLDDSSNAGRYIVKYMEKAIGQELLESFGKKAYLNSRNLKKPEETKFFSKDNLKFNESAVLYETSYTSKIYRCGRLVDNKVRYRKIKLSEEN